MDQYNFDNFRNELNPKDYILSFGKFKGKTLNEIYNDKEGNGYLNYLILDKNTFVYEHVKDQIKIYIDVVKKSKIKINT